MFLPPSDVAIEALGPEYKREAPFDDVVADWADCRGSSVIGVVAAIVAATRVIITITPKTPSFVCFIATFFCRKVLYKKDDYLTEPIFIIIILPKREVVVDRLLGDR